MSLGRVFEDRLPSATIILQVSTISSQTIESTTSN